MASFFSGPVVRQYIMVEGIVELSYLFHDSWETEKRGLGGRRGLEQDVVSKIMSPRTLPSTRFHLLQFLPLPCSLFSYESISGLTHWWEQSRALTIQSFPKGLTAESCPLGTKPSTNEPWVVTPHPNCNSLKENNYRIFKDSISLIHFVIDLDWLLFVI